MSTRIVIVDHPGSGAPTADVLKHMASALQTQVRDHFGTFFPMLDKAITVEAVSTPHATDWVIGLFKDADQPGALGYHDVTPSGQPLAKVFPLLDAEDGGHLSTTISHEVLELLADPLLCKAVQATDGKFWAYEICDAVEQDEYVIDTIPVSNFVLPFYFEPPHNLTGVKFDYMGLCTKAYEIRPGGYGQWNAGRGWHQVVHKDLGPRTYRQKVAGRTTRRVLRNMP